MRIAHLTDLHIGEEGEKPFEVNVRAHFLRVLAAIRALRVDRIIITGDLCLRSGERHIYEWIKAQLALLEIPYDVISGNHDTPALLAQAFDLEAHVENDALYFSKMMEQLPALFLDTTPGELSANQQAWLRNQLSASDREALVFMHHPPLAANVPYMDNNYPLQNRQAVQAIFFAHPHPITVFCGHYHVEKTIRQQNLTVYITPATYFQIDQFQADFAVDHQRPGFRIIDLAEDKIRHTVRYL